MNRRIIISLAFVSCILMACTCGGAGNQNKTKAPPMVPPPQDEAGFKARYGNPDNVSQGVNVRVVSYWTSGVEIVYQRSGNQMVFDRFRDPNTRAELDDFEVLTRMFERDTVRDGTHGKTTPTPTPKK